MKAIQLSLQDQRHEEREVELDVQMATEEEKLKIKTPSTEIFSENNISMNTQDSFWGVDKDMDIRFINI